MRPQNPILIIKALILPSYFATAKGVGFMTLAMWLIFANNSKVQWC